MLDERGRVCRFKARVEEKLFFQEEVIDRSETAPPVSAFEILLFLFGKLVSQDWHVYHADFFIAFLIGHIDGELSVSWYIAIYRLTKSLYRLK